MQDQQVQWIRGTADALRKPARSRGLQVVPWRGTGDTVGIDLVDTMGTVCTITTDGQDTFWQGAVVQAGDRGTITRHDLGDRTGHVADLPEFDITTIVHGVSGWAGSYAESRIWVDQGSHGMMHLYRGDTMVGMARKNHAPVVGYAGWTVYLMDQGDMGSAATYCQHVAADRVPEAATADLAYYEAAQQWWAIRAVEVLDETR